MKRYLADYISTVVIFSGGLWILHSISFELTVFIGLGMIFAELTTRSIHTKDRDE